ncbi:CGNR zinc finger domain-containing protein [Actinomadura syzygii]|nr:ABATE domain-containing protein [Actinomadura syzygii]
MSMEAVGDREWVWYGGRLSTDFVNTRRYRFAGGRELLKAPDDLAAWLAAAKLTSTGVGVAGAEFDAALHLREAVDAGIRATVADEPVPGDAVDVLNHWLDRPAGPARPHLVLRSGVPALERRFDPRDAVTALCRVAADAAELLGTDARRTLRICPGPDCSGRFVDKSPGGRRRWCSMAGCGNRAKAAQHRRTVRTNR